MKSLSYIFNTVKKESAFLYYVVLANFLLVPICILGWIIDDRMLMGVNVWVKPLKFAISTGIYILSLGFFIQLYPFSKRKKRIINNIVSSTLALEMAIIFIQGVRGIQSHYNIHSAIDGMMFAAMGILIGINVLIMGLFVIESIRLKMKTTKAIQWSILLGWIVLIVGSWVGGQMIGQMSHTVGMVDGGPGIPLLNWSTIAGDLRIAHFFGIHGLQIIPLFAYGLSQFWKAGQKSHILAVSGYSAAYIGWMMFTFFQAKQGIALIALQLSQNVI